jgi:SAM-dependent methyltransferase
VQLKGNADRFRGIAADYDLCRPAPPEALLDLLVRRCGRRPRLVVDLGSGTGLSTRPWAPRAARVIGIEPGDEMRARAAAATRARNVEYRAGFGHDTDLPAASADIVTSVQSLHWMEPRRTWREIRRILRPGGVAAVVHYALDPAIHPEVDRAMREAGRRADEICRRRRLTEDQRKWGPKPHAAARERMGFRWTLKASFHREEEGDAARAVGLAISHGDAATALRHGVTLRELGIEGLRRVARRVLGRRRVPWLWSFNAVIVGR